MKPIRRSQAIAPFGPGAMVDFPGPVTLIHAGIDAWPFNLNNLDHEEFKITNERRLAHRLGVDFFVLPPDYRRAQRDSGQTKNLELKLPFLRFPRWHVCPIPSCGRMHRAEFHDKMAPYCKGRGPNEHKKPIKTHQVRFVAACSHGHLTDFPWVEWVFDGKQGDWLPNGTNRWLTLKSSGSASLMGMQVYAEQLDSSGKVELVRYRSLAGSFGSGETVEDNSESIVSPLSKIGVVCTGENPVLGVGTIQRPAPGCGQHLQVILKNATNIYFPNVVSSIYIPEIEDSNLDPEILELFDHPNLKRELREAAQDSDDGLVSIKSAQRLLKKYYPNTSFEPEIIANTANIHLLPGILLENRQTMAILEQYWKTNGGSISEVDIQAILDHINWSIDPKLIINEISEYLKKLLCKQTSSETISQASAESLEENIEEQAYRFDEYKVFTRDIQTGFPKVDLDVRSKPLADYLGLEACGFKRIALLHKLRETRAFDGFSRINSSGLSREARRKLFCSNETNWLPAIIVRGEGIFIEFSHDRLAAWELEHHDELQIRLKPLRQSLAALATRRNQEPQLITPSFLLLHTFAHILITELVQECGYGSASLRERIYSGTQPNQMSGILLYTAAGDSEGTMGGLVRMGEPDRLGTIIRNAVNKARWCSSDPVCIESKGQGPGNCNLAACHSCALLPETSCEHQNRLLDRAMLVGTLENPEIGYFSGLFT